MGTVNNSNKLWHVLFLNMLLCNARSLVYMVKDHQNGCGQFVYLRVIFLLKQPNNKTKNKKIKNNNLRHEKNQKTNTYYIGLTEQK